jgi:CheY-like chemotaxis protein
MDAPCRNRRILVVDHCVHCVRLLSRLLRRLGHEVRMASDGYEAVKAAEEFRPDVILMDIGLPGLDGYEAAARISDRPWGTGVTLIALTGCGGKIDERRYHEAGFDHHLAKPIDPSLLTEMIGTPSAPPS